jgi:hypothetical protein
MMGTGQTNMKIHLQPLYPPTPFIFAIPKAKMPPKAPAKEAALKNKATRNCRSLRLYHMER